MTSYTKQFFCVYRTLLKLRCFHSIKNTSYNQPECFQWISDHVKEWAEKLSFSFQNQMEFDLFALCSFLSSSSRELEREWGLWKEEMKNNSCTIKEEEAKKWIIQRLKRKEEEQKKRKREEEEEEEKKKTDPNLLDQSLEGLLCKLTLTLSKSEKNHSSINLEDLFNIYQIYLYSIHLLNVQPQIEIKISPSSFLCAKYNVWKIYQPQIMCRKNGNIQRQEFLKQALHSFFQLESGCPLIEFPNCEICQETIIDKPFALPFEINHTHTHGSFVCQKKNRFCFDCISKIKMTKEPHASTCSYPHRDSNISLSIPELGLEHKITSSIYSCPLCRQCVTKPFPLYQEKQALELIADLNLKYTCLACKSSQIPFSERKTHLEKCSAIIQCVCFQYFSVLSSSAFDNHSCSVCQCHSLWFPLLDEYELHSQDVSNTNEK